MSQWHGYIYKHGAHLVGTAAGKALPAWVNGSGFLNSVGTPPPTWGGNAAIRNMARAPGGAFWMSQALTGTYTCRAWHQRQMSRYPGNEWQQAWSIYINGPMTQVFVSTAWAAIGRAHHSGSNPSYMWASLQFFNSGGGLISTTDFGEVAKIAGDWGSPGVWGYSSTNTFTVINNRSVACPAGTNRVVLNYTINSGGFEAHDAGDRGPRDWNPDVSIAAGGYGLGMLMADNTEVIKNNVRV